MGLLDKGIFAYGQTGSVISLSNLVGNNGVVAADVTGVGTARTGASALSFGGAPPSAVTAATEEFTDPGTITKTLTS